MSKCLLFAALSAGMAMSAGAISITWISPTSLTDDFAPFVGNVHDLSRVYEITHEDEDSSGAVATLVSGAENWYDFDFNTELSLLKITWNGGSFLTDANIFIKQAKGRGDPSTDGHYVDLVAWNGQETVSLTLTGGWDKWSHIDIAGTGNGLPDGGTTVALLGLSILGLGGVHRMNRARKG